MLLDCDVVRGCSSTVRYGSLLYLKECDRMYGTPREEFPAAANTSREISDMWRASYNSSIDVSSMHIPNENGDQAQNDVGRRTPVAHSPMHHKSPG